MRTRITVLMLLCIFCNCRSIKNNDIEEISFKNEEIKVQYLKAEELLNVCDSIKLSSRVLCLSDKMLINESSGCGLFHVIDLQNEKYLGHFGTVGSGIGQINYAMTLMKDGNEDIQMADMNDRKIVIFDKDNLKFKDEYYISNILPSTNTFVLDKKLYSTSFVKGDHRIYISDLKGNLKSGIGAIQKKYNNNIPDQGSGQGYDAQMGFNNNIIAVSYLTAPILQTYNRKNKKWTTITGPDNFSSIFEINDKNYFHYTKDTRLGYVDVKVTNKYIYALYSGKELFFQNKYPCKDIYVFNLNGTPVKHYILNEGITNFDLRDEYIYGYYMGDKANRLFKFHIR